MKKVVLLEHDGGELANQLWNYISVYAYALERGYTCENWSFFEYPDHFARKQEGRIIRYLFVPWFRGFTKRRSAVRRRVARKLYKLLVSNPMHVLSRRVVYSTEVAGAAYYLPPTGEASAHLSRLENSKGPIYLAQVSGAVYRNPDGIMKHREKIIEAFRPASDITSTVTKTTEALRARYTHVVGVHIRQGDYTTFKGGKYFIEQRRVRQILDQYLLERNLSANEACFFIASDGKIDESLFNGLAIHVSKASAGEDLFTLAACDAVIGSDSTFGHFAAYYGNVPHIVMKKEQMDWGYYQGKNTYFVNTYLTIMQF